MHKYYIIKVVAGTEEQIKEVAGSLTNNNFIESSILLYDRQITKQHFQPLIQNCLDNMSAINNREECTEACLQLHNTGVAQVIVDYEEVLEDHKRLVREMDEIINGEGLAKQASLCDIVSQLSSMKKLFVKHNVVDKPFSKWLKKNNYFKSKKGPKKNYENKFLEGFFTRKDLYKLFKKEKSKE